jgi:crotonobetainyl-CoA:carnitine CoA-transferase CaiB-like acyl-CoA transferase
MMGGLAYMTGPPGRPLRAGASIIDVTGGIFGAIAILAALQERARTGKGQYVSASLFETTAFLVGQHMAQFAVTGKPAAPMPTRVSAWAVYDVFDVLDGEKVFVGVVSDGQWSNFCKEFSFDDWAEDVGLAANNDRVARRDEIMPQLRALFATIDRDELMSRLERTGLPFAPIMRPEDLFDDVHLNAEGGLVEMDLPDGGRVKLPSMPIALSGIRPGLHLSPPSIGEQSREILASLGLSQQRVDKLVEQGIVEAKAAVRTKTSAG